jgi:hypothetical protein
MYYFILLVTLLGALVITSNILHYVAYRKHLDNFIVTEPFQLTSFVISTLFFFSSVAICVYQSLSKLKLAYMELLIFGLFYEFNEITFGISLIIMITGIGLSYIGEFLIRLCRRQVQCRCKNDGMVSIKVTVISFDRTKPDAEDIKACVICQYDIKNTDKVCKLECSCKAIYHKNCIVEWYGEHHECPLCKKYANLM